MNNQSKENGMKHTPEISLSDEQRRNFIRGMKIGYYREFYKQGLITSEQLAQLIAMQDKPSEQFAA